MNITVSNKKNAEIAPWSTTPGQARHASSGTARYNDSRKTGLPQLCRGGRQDELEKEIRERSKTVGQTHSGKRKKSLERERHLHTGTRRMEHKDGGKRGQDTYLKSGEASAKRENERREDLYRRLSNG